MKSAVVMVGRMVTTAVVEKAALTAEKSVGRLDIATAVQKVDDLVGMWVD